MVMHVISREDGLDHVNKYSFSLVHELLYCVCVFITMCLLYKRQNFPAYMRN